MKIWVAYRFTGADHDQLKATLLEVRRLLEASGHTVMTMIEDIQQWHAMPMFQIDAIKRMNELSCECDVMLAICDGLEPSEGRGYECGMFTARGQATIMAMHSTIMLSEYYQGLYLANPANEKLGVPSIISYRNLEFIPAALASHDRIVAEPAPPLSAPPPDSWVNRPPRNPRYPLKSDGNIG